MNKISDRNTFPTMTGSVSAQAVHDDCHDECHDHDDCHEKCDCHDECHDHNDCHEKCDCHDECHDHDDCHEKCDCHDECHDHDDCHGIESVVESTIKCYKELRGLVREIFERLDTEPSTQRLLIVHTCLILEDISVIFKEIAKLKKRLCYYKCRPTDIDIADERFSLNVTSGTVFVTSDQTDKVRVTIVNNTADQQTVRVKILNTSVNPHAVITEIALEVNSGCSGLIRQSLDGASSYEIQVFDLVPGMTVSSVEETTSGSFVEGSKLVAAAFIPH